MSFYVSLVMSGGLLRRRRRRKVGCNKLFIRRIWKCDLEILYCDFYKLLFSEKPCSSIFPRKFTKRDQKPHTAQHLSSSSSSASSERGRWRSTKNSTKIVEKPICHIWNIIWKNLNENLNPQEPLKSLEFLLHYLCIHVLLCEFLCPLAQFRKDVEKVFGRKTK